VGIRCFVVEQVPDSARPLLWRRVDTGEVLGGACDLPAGAMWDAHWFPRNEGWKRGSDGRRLIVRCPGGYDWDVDGQARNCSRPGEDHDCWCRHGEWPDVTVDKVPEPGRSTCRAGAGSIVVPGWHGFLRAGELVGI
jgi:hypothetical protein